MPTAGTKFMNLLNKLMNPGGDILNMIFFRGGAFSMAMIDAVNSFNAHDLYAFGYKAAKAIVAFIGI